MATNLPKYMGPPKAEKKREMTEEEKKYYEKTLPKVGEGEEGGRGDIGIGDFKLKDASGEKSPAEREGKSSEVPAAAGTKEEEAIPKEQLEQLQAKREAERAPGEEAKELGDKAGKLIIAGAKKGQKESKEQQLARLRGSGASAKDLKKAEATLLSGKAQAGGKMQKDAKGNRQRKKETTNRVNAQGEKGGRVKKRVVEEVKGEVKKSATRKAVEILASAESPITGTLLAVDAAKKLLGRNKT